MTNAELPSGVEKTVVGEDELQRLMVNRFPAGHESDAFFASLGPADYWNNLRTIVDDARELLWLLTGLMPDDPPDPNLFEVFSNGWYAATCWGFADALLLREEATLEQRLAWSHRLH